MRSLKIAVASHCFAQPLKQSILSAASSGARGVQFDVRNELKPTDFSETGRRQLLHHLEELRLSVASLTFPTRRALYERDQLEARVSAAKNAMRFASQLKSRVLTARIGPIPGESESEDYELLSGVLNDLARYGNHVGVVFSITPTFGSSAPLSRLLSTVIDGPIGINFDPVPFVLSDEQPAEALRSLHDVISHVRVRDAVRDMDGTGLEMAVGRGEVLWDEFLATIDEIGYRG